MILGAQLYSLRDHTGDEAGMREVFHRVKEMGYECVQVSGGAALSGETFRAISEETGLPILTTHTALPRLLNDTDAVIAEHLAFGAKQIGIGAPPPEYRGSLEAVRSLIRALEEPVRKMREAGLFFGYHNHHFEFEPIGDTNMYEIILQETDWQMIADVYWYRYAGVDPVAMLKRLRGRIPYIHLKDMAKEDTGITACGTGRIDFAPIIKAAEENGALAAFVEQDNAPELAGGSYWQMATGARLMLPQVHHASIGD